MCVYVCCSAVGQMCQWIADCSCTGVLWDAEAGGWWCWTMEGRTAGVISSVFYSSVICCVAFCRITQEADHNDAGSEVRAQVASAHELRWALNANIVQTSKFLFVFLMSLFSLHPSVLHPDTAVVPCQCFSKDRQLQNSLEALFLTKLFTYTRRWLHYNFENVHAVRVRR